MGRRTPDRGTLTAPDGAVSVERDAGLFGPGSEAWRLDREAVLLLGAGPRALLLQVAHPAVAAGVAEHSAFRVDPWGRLLATIRSYLRIVYGTTAQARAEVRRLNRLHSGIRGPGYTGRDPELAAWVHATLVDSTIVAHDAWVEPLPAARRARFLEEMRPLGRLYGIPDALLPVEPAAFTAYLERMLGPGGPVVVGPTARDIARTIRRPALRPLARVTPGLRRVPGAAALLGLVPAGATSWLLWPSIGLLPTGVRVAYGLPWGPRERLVAGWLTAGFRAWRPIVPGALRQMPQARAADRRLAARDRRLPVPDRRLAVPA